MKAHAKNTAIYRNPYNLGERPKIHLDTSRLALRADLSRQSLIIIELGKGGGGGILEFYIIMISRRNHVIDEPCFLICSL